MIILTIAAVSSQTHPGVLSTTVLVAANDIAWSPNRSNKKAVANTNVTGTRLPIKISFFKIIPFGYYTNLIGKVKPGF
jgi:hypothetical protein